MSLYYLIILYYIYIYIYIYIFFDQHKVIINLNRGIIFNKHDENLAKKINKINFKKDKIKNETKGPFQLVHFSQIQPVNVTNH